MTPFEVRGHVVSTHVRPRGSHWRTWTQSSSRAVIAHVKMPRDVSSSSSSSSEDEEDKQPTEPAVRQKETEGREKKTTRYQCPADFVSFRHEPRSGGGGDELWLIKAPAGFNPQCLAGIQVPLSGLQTLKVPAAAGGVQTGSGQQVYSVLASTGGTSELRLLTGGGASTGGVVVGPLFSGLLNVCESYGDGGASQAPQVIPAAPPPAMPLGLKQRFHPFGSKTPTLTCVAESEVDGAALGPSSKTLRPLVAKQLVEETWQEEDEDGRRKKKKKRKKDERIKTERDEEEGGIRVKQEPAADIQDQLMPELHLQEEKRRRKKKKKDREREEVEEGVEPSVAVKQEDVVVKCEPIDCSYGDVVEARKKKKKRKRTDDD